MKQTLGGFWLAQRGQSSLGYFACLNNQSFRPCAPNRSFFFTAALVISALGYNPYNPLEDAARKACDEVFVIGSAVEEGDVMSATKDGYECGLKI